MPWRHRANPRFSAHLSRGRCPALERAAAWLSHWGIVAQVSSTPCLGGSKLEPVVPVQLDPEAEAPAHPVEGVAQPSGGLRRRVVHPEVPDLHRLHAEIGEPAGGGIQRRGVQQRQIVAELLVTGDSFVVIEEVAAPVEDELALEYFDRADV